MAASGLKSVPLALTSDTTALAVQASVQDLLAQGRLRLQRGLAGEADAEEVVHQTRVDMKRLRALGYLLRDGMTASAAAQWQQRCRLLAGGLGGRRDRQVMLATLAELSSGLPAAVVQRLSTAIPVADAGAGSELARTLALLDALASQLAGLDLGGLRRGHLHQGLAFSFGKGRRGHERAIERDDEALLHRWRKWVKVLHYQLEWLDLAPRWSLALKPLGSCLGEIHDLDVLAGRLRAGGAPEEDLALLAPRLQQARQSRVAQARGLAPRCFAGRSPRRRVGRLFRRWCRQGERVLR